MNGECILILITCPEESESKNIARELVNKRFAACVNIVSPVYSIFYWEDKVQEEGESLLIVKTEKKLLDSIIEVVKKLHSYTVPEVIAIPMIGGNKAYLKWINDVVRGGELT